MEEEKKLDLENKAEDEKELSSEELKKQAEALEAENKQLKEQDANKEAELKANYERRLEKAREQNAKLKETINETIKQSIDTRDLVTLGVKGISEDSDEALILKKYKDDVFEDDNPGEDDDQGRGVRTVTNPISSAVQ